VENLPSEGSQLDEQPEAATEESAPVAEATEEESIESGAGEAPEADEGDSPEEAQEDVEQ
jgi:hypothetical protein